MKITVDTSALRGISSRLRDISGAGSRRLRQDIEDYATSANRIDVMDELDARGVKLVPWRVRTGHYAALRGPTMAAHGASSNRIAGFFVRSTQRLSGWTVEIGFRPLSAKMAMVFEWHRQGLAGRGRGGGSTGIVRDVISGIPPQRVARIRQMVREFYERGARYGR